MSEPLVDLLADVEGRLRELLQGQQLGDPSLLTRVQNVQNQLYELHGKPPMGRPRLQIVQPTAQALDLTPDEEVIWRTFVRYHNALLAYAGDTTDQGWVALMSVASDLTGAFFAAVPGGNNGITTD